MLDGSGRLLAEGVPLGPAAFPLGMSVRVKPGTYRFSVVARDRAPLTYELLSAFEPTPRVAAKPPPPPPRPRKVRIPVLEREESRSGGSNVLLAEGRDRQLLPCLKGKLLDGSQVIGEIELLEIFEEGSRARVVGSLRGTITSRTVAEIEIPVRASDRPRCD